MARVLVVEDSPDLAFGLRTNLELEGHQTRLAEDGELALRVYQEFHPDIIILDLMLPKLNGFGVLQRLREDRQDVPVVILSAQHEEVAKIRGFRLGADDFVTKPFSVLELMARIEALLRRAAHRRGDRENQADSRQIHFGDVDVDLMTQTVFRRGEKVEVSPKAFELMVALINRQGAVARRDDLLKDVWGYRRMITTRTVDAHVLELRRKLERDPANPEHFVTVRKAGYRFQQ